MNRERKFGIWRIIRHTSHGDIVGPWQKNTTMARTYDIAMALLNGEIGYSGYQYLAIGTGDPAWDSLSQPPEANPETTHLFPYASPAQIQQLSILGNPTDGTFTLSFKNVSSGSITYNAIAGYPSATVIQTALTGISTIGAGNVLVAGPNGGPYTITFVGTLGSGPQPNIVVATINLTGGINTVVQVLPVNVPPPNSIVTGEFARFPFDSANRVYLDENGVPLTTLNQVSRYCRISAHIPQGSLAPTDNTQPAVEYRELAWVGGANASQAIGTGMYMSIVRIPKEVRQFNDEAITIQTNVEI